MADEADKPDTSEFELFETFEEARDAFNSALPDFKCIVCQHPQQAVVGGDIAGEHTRVNVHLPENPAVEWYVPTLAVICLNCGYVMSFAQEEIRNLASRMRAKNG
ncbi:MAG TPA: hypothetical protein VGO49_05825 [Bradyrhizobium sp.]|jgi:hypothetical protein|nr:hypothetical protein [Bradyrhizobium sp.]